MDGFGHGVGRHVHAASSPRQRGVVAAASRQRREVVAPVSGCAAIC